MNQKINKNRFLINTILIFVFSLLSISAPAQTYVWAQSNNDQLLHIDEKRKIYEVSTKQAERTASKKQNQNRYMLIPGGDAIGIKIQTDGLVVVDTYLVNTEGGTINPAKEAGVMKGDMILAVNNQKISTKFKDIAIELIEVKQFKDGHIIINSLKDDSSQVSVKTITKNDKVFESVSREIKVYTEEDHLNNGSDKTKELYEDLKSAILNIDSSIKIEAKKLYIAFKQSTNICDVEIQKDKLKIYLNAKWGTIDDPKHLFKDVRKVGHWGNGEYRAEISDDNNIGYIIDLIRQVIQKQ